MTLRLKNVKIKLIIYLDNRRELNIMKKIGVKRFLAYFSISALIISTITMPMGASAVYGQGIRRDFPEQAAMYNKNELDFQKLNKKIHNRDLKHTLGKIEKAKDTVIPILSSIIYFSLAISSKGGKLDIKDACKHATIAVGVGETSKLLEKMSSYLIDKFV